MNINDVRESATMFPRTCKLAFDLLTLKVVSESRVTWDEIGRFATSSKYTAWAMLATASAQVCVPLGHSSLSILCLEHHYCGDQQWRLLT